MSQFNELSLNEKQVLRALAKGPAQVADLATRIQTEGEDRKKVRDRTRNMIRRFQTRGWAGPAPEKGFYLLTEVGYGLLLELPKQGQGGEPIKMGWEDFSDFEQRVAKALFACGTLKISEIVIACGWDNLTPGRGALKGPALGNSRVRNQLRRLVRSGWVLNAEGRGRGRYKLAPEADEFLQELMGLHRVAPMV